MSFKRKVVRNMIRRKYGNKAVRDIFGRYQEARNKKRVLRKVAK